MPHETLPPPSPQVLHASSTTGSGLQARYEDHGPPHAFLSQRLLYKLPHLAAALPHQTDNRQISRRIPRHSSQSACSFPHPSHQKIPILCLRPTVSIPSRTRTPVLIGSLNRDSLHRVWSHTIQRPQLTRSRCGSPSRGTPSESNTLPVRSSLTAIPGVTPVADNASPYRIPSRCLQRHRQHIASVESNHLTPMTSPPSRPQSHSTPHQNMEGPPTPPSAHSPLPTRPLHLAGQGVRSS